MSSERVRRRVRALGLAGMLSLACADFERGAPRPDAAVPDAGDAAADAATASVSFARDVHRLLLDGCARCHGPGGAAASTGLVYTGDAGRDREGSLAFVNREQPASSRLVSKAAGLGHAGGTVYGAGTPEHTTIVGWIAEGTPP